MAAKRIRPPAGSPVADLSIILHETRQEFIEANAERLELRRRIARAERILRTPGMWSDFAARALDALAGADGE